MSDTSPINIIGGHVTFKAGDIQLVAQADVTVDFTGTERTEAVGLGGLAGGTEMPVAYVIEGTFFFTKNIDPRVLNSKRNIVVTVESRDGRTYTLGRAFHTGRSPISLAAGTLPARFVGFDAEIDGVVVS